MLNGFVKKYESYGEVCGSVRLPLREPEEVDAMEGLLGKPLQGQRTVTVSAAALRKVLSESRFAGVDLNTLVQAFAGGEIEVHSERKRKVKELYRNEILRAKEKTHDPVAEDFFRDLLQAEEKPVSEEEICEEALSIHRMLLRQYHMFLEKKEEEAISFLEKYLNLIAEIVENLPVRKRKYQYLAVFASDLTGDPHAFDRGTFSGVLLNKILLWYENRFHPVRQSFSVPDGFNSVRRGQLYLTCGIMIDDVSNYVVSYGVRTALENGKEDPGMAGFHEEQAVVQVPLSVLTRWTAAFGNHGKILVVENPSVFSMMVSRYPERSFMCMNGQPRLAGLVMLHLLSESGTEIAYGGDLDPEGIRIADRLWEFSGRKILLWHMSEEDYLKHVKDTGTTSGLSERRLHMLEKIHHPELKKTAEAVRHYKKAVYQESFLKNHC